MTPPVSAAPCFELLGFYYGKITNARKVGKREERLKGTWLEFRRNLLGAIVAATSIVGLGLGIAH